MKLTLINLNDAQALLEFEITNKQWFEQFIPPREQHFYSLVGVKQHIREFLLDFKCNEMIPLLIKSDNNRIIGRINITNIDGNKRIAHLGYRVGKSEIKQGVAKWAVSEVIDMLKKQNIKQLYAYAEIRNVASQSVLSANGFSKVRLVKNFAKLHGQAIDCLEYKRLIP
ncbi:GNAT family N-acetyltransferase [Vibrio pacinii]|uniref:GNAT family N-acetyltransferase n=1 Tax=Vibrio pacinii TaxID=170674 RepID=UPI00056FC0CF|nr:GNAT family N-acetyltransferase [Vibrio pacinii]